MKLRNAKIVAENVDPNIYHRRDPNIKRGDMEYVMSCSELVEFANCQGRWKAGYKDGDNEDKTKSLEWGSLIDTLLLDQERFDDKYAICPETYVNDTGDEKKWNGNANDCKEWLRQHKNKNIIKEKKIDEAVAALKRIRQDEIIANVLTASRFQVMVIGDYHDEKTGIIIPCRALIDLLPPDESIVDLKTCRSAQHEAWKRQIYQFGYHIQAAFYLDLYNSAMPDDKRIEFIHILQENFSPWETGRRMLSEEFLTIGRVNYEYALRLYCKCLATKTWPGYDDGEDGNQINGWTIVEPESYMA